jgi:hypothetical protein
MVYVAADETVLFFDGWIGGGVAGPWVGGGVVVVAPFRLCNAFRLDIWSRKMNKLSEVIQERTHKMIGEFQTRHICRSILKVYDDKLLVLVCRMQQR